VTILKKHAFRLDGSTFCPSIRNGIPKPQPCIGSAEVIAASRTPGTARTVASASFT
jgi:hypothetical protein